MNPRLFTLRIVFDPEQSVEDVVDSLEPVLEPFGADVQDGWIDDLGPFHLLRAWVTVLGEDSAAEVIAALSAHAFDAGLDLSLVEGVDPLPQEGLLAFDADSTLVDGEGIDELALRAGVGEKVAAITARAMAGELDFAASLRERVACLKGLPESALAELASELRLMPGADEAVQAAQAQRWQVAVFSGGFDFYLEEVRRRLGLDHAFGNALGVRDGALDGKLKGPVFDAAAKRRKLEELSPGAAIAIGDGANDVPMFQAARVAIAFCPKPALVPHANGVCHRRDLRVAVALSGLVDGD